MIIVIIIGVIMCYNDDNNNNHMRCKKPTPRSPNKNLESGQVRIPGREIRGPHSE